MNFEQLYEIFSMKKGFFNFLKEVNKVLGYSSLTILGISCFTKFRKMQMELLTSSLLHSVGHLLLSVYLLYGTGKFPTIGYWTPYYLKKDSKIRNLKKLSNFCGLLGYICLWLYNFGKLNYYYTTIATILLGSIHQ